MRIVIAPDSFKGTLSSETIIKIVKEEAINILPSCDIISIPMADGGEGTEKIMVDLMKGFHREVSVEDPAGNRIQAGYGVLNKSTALVEMASASGLTLVCKEKRDPWEASSYGTGELIRQALEDGYRNIIVAVGGSATNDGGMGAMSALGVRFLDKENHILKGSGKELNRVTAIDASRINPAIKESKITVMCDVKNPLLGKNGASYVYGPQKGADFEMIKKLEQGMENYARVMEKSTGIHIGSLPGTGAAGGISAALKVFCNAELKSGVETILELIDFYSILEHTDLVITGEGRVDGQSAQGKVLAGIGEYCKKAGVPAIAIAGGMGEGSEEIYKKGILSVMPSVSGFLSEKEGLERAEELLKDAAKRMFTFIKIGMDI